MAAAIELRAVTLVRRTQEEFHYDLKRTFFDLLRGRARRARKRTILDRVSLRAERGEKLAIIGANGSGKSTILKVIAGVLAPTRGSVQVTGSLSPLIELGAGFEPELSLVDNIVYYGVVLGHPERTVRENVDAILDFAELRDMRDAPTKTLSSGMAARLAFAIATQFRPEVLLLDEVLAVGDERFRRKCAERLERFWDAHSTIVVVSHDMHYIRATCERVIWVDHGTVRFDGPAAEGVQHYLDTVPAGAGFARGEELLDAARRSPRGEIVVRGTSPTDQGRKVFLIRDGRRHWVTSPDWYDKVGYGWDDIVHVDDTVILEVPEGEILV
ncbi:MAG TPA: ABC transporter ATP-binding protein [Candidatus Elarobacter sp.]|jgi:ABC-type polysaccharide/polyol phosphate transport system ATPase subunit|nr:ABC transporter ATP-binding protein [Candidatus Elarobacter sp.]